MKREIFVITKTAYNIATGSFVVNGSLRKSGDTGNEGEAEREAFPAISVTLQVDTKAFYKTNGVSNEDMFA